MTRDAYLSRQRWFAGSEATIVGVEELPWILDPSGGLGVRFELVTVDGGHTYNVPASYRREPFPGLDGALMDVVDGTYVYDAMLDTLARTALLSGFLDEQGLVGGVAYETDAPLGLRPGTPTVPLVARQSNTSIVVGDDLLWKLFRIVGPGTNPDIEVGRALTATGAPEVAPVRGWMTAGDVDLAMIYDYYATATDGWESARASFRDLRADPDQTPAQAGADFSAEAARLGGAVASIHRLMAPLATGEWGVSELEVLSTRLITRFAESKAIAPQLAPWADAAHAAYAELTALTDPVQVQRIHGDLHLGQTLRTVGGWKVFDFEGEPAKPLADRARLDSPLRDVAAMLRSFDYAPRSVLMQVGDDSAESTARAADWTARNCEAFLRGYDIGADPTAYALLRCYQIDKAAYEVAYEMQHRPGWTGIPMDALGRLLG
jgi:maltokinase